MKSKLPNSGTSIFAKMTALANQYQAINLAQGFPNFNPPAELLGYLTEAVENGWNQYAAMPGYLPLRQQISKRLIKDYNYNVDPEAEITINAGATQSIYTSISAFISQGDKVIIFEPAYDSYGPAVLVNGGIPVYLRLNLPDFSIPWDQLEQVMKTEDIKMILINNPHNPSGRILHQEDLLRFEKLIHHRDTILLFDEVYDLLVYDNKKHISALGFEKLMNQSIVVFSMGKSLHNTGWKIGACIAKSVYTNEIRKVHQFTVFSVNTPAQYAIAKFMENYPDFFYSLSGFYQNKRDFFINKLHEGSFDLMPCEGSYFALASYNKISEESDIEMAKILVESNGVACIPISAFYHDAFDPKILRFCFAKNEDTLQQAVNKLNAI